MYVSIILSHTIQRGIIIHTYVQIWCSRALFTALYMCIIDIHDNESIEDVVWIVCSPELFSLTFNSLHSYCHVYHLVRRIIQNSRINLSKCTYSTVQYSTVQYRTVQYSTVQYRTVQYSTVQYMHNDRLCKARRV